MNVRLKSEILFIESQHFPVPSYHLRDLRSTQKKVDFCFEGALEIRDPIYTKSSFSVFVLSPKGSEVGLENC